MQKGHKEVKITIGTKTWTVLFLTHSLLKHSLYKYKTRRYRPLCEPTSGFCGGLRPLAQAFFALGNLSNFEKNTENSKKSKKKI